MNEPDFYTKEYVFELVKKHEKLEQLCSKLFNEDIAFENEYYETLDKIGELVKKK